MVEHLKLLSKNFNPGSKPSDKILSEKATLELMSSADKNVMKDPPTIMSSRINMVAPVQTEAQAQQRFNTKETHEGNKPSLGGQMHASKQQLFCL